MSAGDTTGGRYSASACRRGLSCRLRGQRGERMCRPHRRPPAPRRPRPAYADKDRSRASGIRSRSRRDRSVPSTSGSGLILGRNFDLSAILSSRARRRGGQRRRGRSARRSRSRSARASRRRSGRPWPTRGRPRADRRGRAASHRTSASRRGKAATPASRGDGVARRSHRQRDRSARSRPSGTSLIETRHGPWSRLGLDCVQPCAIRLVLVGSHLSQHRPAPGSGKASSRALETLASCDRQTRVPPRAHRPRAGRAAPVRCLGKDVARKRRHKRLLVGRRQAPPGRPPAGHRMPRRSGAFFGAPRDRPRPFRACCRPCRGRSGRTAPGRAPGPVPPRASSRRRDQHGMQHDHLQTPVNRIRDAVDLVKRRRSRLCHDRAIERRDAVGPAGCGETGAISLG